MSAHLRKPHLVPAPEAYTEYCLERRFWEEFGAPQPPLDDWPRRKVAEYTRIQRAIDEVTRERERTPAIGSGAGGPPGSAAGPATEEAYQRMRTQAVTPTLPPPPPT